MRVVCKLPLLPTPALLTYSLTCCFHSIFLFTRQLQCIANSTGNRVVEEPASLRVVAKSVKCASKSKERLAGGISCSCLRYRLLREREREREDSGL